MYATKAMRPRVSVIVRVLANDSPETNLYIYLVEFLYFYIDDCYTKYCIFTQVRCIPPLVAYTIFEYITNK